MEHEYLYEKEELTEELQDRLDEANETEHKANEFCCPYCGSIDVYEAYLNEYGDMIYYCDNCENEITSDELELI